MSLSQSDIKAYLYGLIHRDPEGWASEEDRRKWVASPEGQQELQRVEQRKRGDLRMWSFSTPTPNGFSLKYVELSREAAQQMIVEHGQDRFSDEFIEWANQVPAAR